MTSNTYYAGATIQSLSTRFLFVIVLYYISTPYNHSTVYGFVPHNSQQIQRIRDNKSYNNQLQHRFVNTRSYLSATVVPVQDDGSSRSSSSSINEESVQSQLPDMEAYANGYRTSYKEVSFQRCNTPKYGTLPTDLIGTYFRSGPAMFSAGSIVPPKTSIVQPRQPPVPDGTDTDRMVPHPFEGDGAIIAITFGKQQDEEGEDGEDGDGSEKVESETTTTKTTTSEDMEVTMRYRFVRTIAFIAERKKGGRSYKGMDTTRDIGPSIVNDLPIPAFRHHLLPGLNKFRKNTSNTRAIYWCKRLFTMWEGGLPYKIDARACDTEGKSRFGGAVQRDLDPLGSKMVIDSKTNRAIFYGIQQQGIKSSNIITYEFDEAFKLVRGGRIEYDNIPGFALITDFAVTTNYNVLIQPDVSVRNAFEFTIGSKDPGTSLTIGSGPATLHLLPRPGSNRAQKTIQIPFLSNKDDDATDINVHFINAFENEDQTEVTIDIIRSCDKNMKSNSNSNKKMLTWPWGRTIEEYQSHATKKSLWRYIVNINTGTIQKILLSNRHCYFGTINQQYSAQQYNYMYMNVGSVIDNNKSSPPQGIAKYSINTSKMDIWMPHPYEFCGEPMYAPRVHEKKNDNDIKTNSADVAEDDGYILSILYNGKSNESEIIILDATKISNGPICRISLDGIAIPHGHFGCYAAGVIWSSNEIERRAKLSDKIESKGNRWNEVKSDFSGLGLRLDDMEEYFGDFFSR